MEELKMELRKYFINNLGELQNIVKDINWINGGLNSYIFYEMNELDEVLDCYTISTVLKMIDYTYFNINEQYFTFDYLGNIVSYSEYDYINYILDNLETIIDEFIKVLKSYDKYYKYQLTLSENLRDIIIEHEHKFY